MKISFPCSRCLEDAINTGRPPKVDVVRLSPSDSDCYEAKCSNGHVTHYVLQHMRFEILFEIGAHAIIDDYYREAISSFTSALERFLELYVKVVCLRNGLASEQINSMWKTVNSQSERQLGAYLFLYGVTERAQAPYLSQKMTELRNNVIHKGRFPSRDDAVNYGNSVLAIINPTLRLLKQRDMDILNNLMFENMMLAMSSYPFAITRRRSIDPIVSIFRDVSEPDITDLSSWSPRRYF
jgi:hypothetical protein